MDVKVFESQDGALVIVPAEVSVADELIRLGALHYLGQARMPAGSLSHELLGVLSRGGPGIAQPADVIHVLRATGEPRSADPPRDC